MFIIESVSIFLLESELNKGGQIIVMWLTSNVYFAEKLYLVFFRILIIKKKCIIYIYFNSIIWQEWNKKIKPVTECKIKPSGKSLKISITQSSRIEIFTYAMIDLYLNELYLLKKTRNNLRVNDLSSMPAPTI